MNFEDLKNKALLLPLAPGVYIMKDRDDRVIYVGKAKKLKNRVSQYFQDSSAHTPKTRQMVSNIDHFDTIVVASEFEALVLECSLIKRHRPKYNILLKDDKGYPYVRINLNDAYPKLSIVNTVLDDGAEYFGPFGSRGVTKGLMDTINLILKLPTCNKSFPRDVGKDRPCLNYHMNQCAGWCLPQLTQAEHRQLILRAKQLLQGNYKVVTNELRRQMLAASEELKFELAASIRDRLSALESLGKKQTLISGIGKSIDVIGFTQTGNKACFTVLHFIGGNLVDKEYQILTTQDSPEEIVSALIKQYYLYRGVAPRGILLPFQLDDSNEFAELLTQTYQKKIELKVPKRGRNTDLVALATENAKEELASATNADEQANFLIQSLGKMLGIPTPNRIESFDISNLSGTDIVASMVVFCDGRSKRSEYKHFKIKDLEYQDDYASMAQVVRRRFLHYLQGDSGFDTLPDLLLIDGGVTHACTVKGVLDELGLTLPVFGMVKDDRHRTRALVTPAGAEIRIDNQQSIFAFIGNIQEETHRFAIGYHKKLRSKRLKYSELNQIPNIGEQRKQHLLKVFKSINNIRNASLSELEQHLPQNAARSVYAYFRDKE